MSIDQEKLDLPKDGIIVSKKEYRRLKNDSNFLRALEAAGVDNWDGYDIASDNYEEEKED